MKNKRNTNNSPILTRGYVKKYFGPEIGRILVPNNRNLQNCETPYVPHPEAELVLEDCLLGDPNKDKSLLFTGLTGSGKSTILRHVFDIEASANMPKRKGSALLIPVDFNRAQANAQIAILSSVRVAIEKVCEEDGIDFPNNNNEEFYTFIKDRRADFLKINPDNSGTESHQEQLDSFFKYLPDAYASCQLQYVMDKPNCKTKLVVLIVDNIEAFSTTGATLVKDKYLSPVIESFRLAECISQRDNPTVWCFNMVIACRHHIWRIMRGEFSDDCPESALLQSYITTELPYDLANPVKVNDIIKRREEVFARKQRDPDKWNTAITVVNTIMEKMDNGIGDFVLQLMLKDLRKSMFFIQELVTNRGLQRKTDQEIAGAFEINSIEQFDLSRVNLIRTLGLGGSKYYSGRSSIIPNLLANEKNDEKEMYLLLTLKYFLNQCGYVEPTWDNPILVSQFYERVKFIFGCNENRAEFLFGQSVHYLLQHRLLLRSADQQQDDVPGLSLSDVRNIEKVYVSGAAISLWNELGKSSALFQLYMDDIWFEENESYFENDGNDIEHCLSYLKTLYGKENSIYNSAKNLGLVNEEHYIKNFGIEPVCKQLLSGLKASLVTICISVGSYSRVHKARVTLKSVREFEKELRKREIAYQEVLNNSVTPC